METGRGSRMNLTLMMTNVSAAEKLDTLRRLELAAGVEVALHPAGPLVRLSAWIMDFLWMTLANVLIWLLVMFLSVTAGEEVGGGVALLLAFVMSWLYRVFFEVRRGSTPGQKSKGLKVVMTSGAPVTLSASVLRNVLRVADFFPACYLTGLVSCLMSRHFQRLGDLVADTMVIYAHPADGPGGLIPPTDWAEPQPPRLPLGREERAAVVRFAERLPMWSESRRVELANHLSALTGATGPEGVRRLAGIARWLRDS